MAMVSFGLMEILLLLASSAGIPANDLVSLVPVEDYFKSRMIEVSADKMIEFAGKAPADSKTSVQQLLAIRWLGENPDAAKKGKGARDLLEQIAAGKKAQDSHGFAKAHAAQALARLDGKPVPPLATVPDKSLRGDALAWFPADSNMAAGVEMRSGTKSNDTALAAIRKLAERTVKERERAVAYDMLDGMGNVRIDRVSASFRFDEEGLAQRFCVRFSGGGDRKALAALFAFPFKGRAQFQEKKGPGGEALMVLDTPDATYVFVGDGDLLILGGKGAKSAEMLDEVLAVKNGKKKSLAEGGLADLLRSTPDNARFLVASDLPKASRASFTEGDSPFKAAPSRILAYAAPDQKLNVTVLATMKDNDEAKAFAEASRELIKKGLTALDNPPPQSKIPEETLKRARETLKAIKVEPEGKLVQAKVSIDAAQTLADLVLYLFQLEKRDRPEKP